MRFDSGRRSGEEGAFSVFGGLVDLGGEALFGCHGLGWGVGLRVI